MDFGPMKAAFGHDGNRHNKKTSENVRMAYDDMFIDAPETVKMAASAIDARDSEDDVISLSCKASADPRSHSSGSEERQQVYHDPHFEQQY